MRVLVVVAAAALLLLCQRSDAQVNCILHPPEGGTVDLTKIPTKPVRMVVLYQGGQTEHVFKFSFCQQSHDPPPGMKACADSYIGQWSMATDCEAQFEGITAQPAWASGTVTIAYGSIWGYKANVAIKCGSDDLAPAGIINVNDALEYAIGLQSRFVCNGRPPTPSDGPDEDGGLSGGGVFVIILSVVLVVYVGGMVAFAYFKENKRGKDLIPHPDFWSSIPGLVKDGCKYTYETARSLASRVGAGAGGGGGGGGSTATYQAV